MMTRSPCFAGLGDARVNVIFGGKAAASLMTTELGALMLALPARSWPLAVKVVLPSAAAFETVAPVQVNTEPGIDPEQAGAPPEVRNAAVIVGVAPSGPLALTTKVI